ncbi:rRNA-binding ribosome biosynthesis protein utp25 [Knufia fluminis]|uniref:U3 small nucleolar RNA-associated protein 25 n=2 Tax=Knufia TaxID=430999 RepID=A0AAN8EI44_9EURO|nr:rRNA-binding ribosome biosynthesis protein utp25 [Knufia fluminis]
MVQEEAEEFPEEDGTIDADDGDAAEEDTSASEDELETPAHSYATLLRALKPAASAEGRSAKRRKLENGHSDAKDSKRRSGAPPEQDVNGQEDEHLGAELVEDEDEASAADEPEEVDSDDEDFVLHDPFERHYANVVEDDLAAAIRQQEQKGNSEKATLGHDTRKIITTYTQKRKSPKPKKGTGNPKLKHRLLETGAAITSNLRPEEQDIMSELFDYKDILCGSRSLDNAAKFRDLSALHSLNHIFKTRDRVLKNNAKLAQESSGDAEYRDQGFTRPKVLVLVPTKQACVRFIESIIKLSQPDQQENRSRFMDHFSQPEDHTFDNKPEDFRDLFGGNHEEDFRVGLKFTRKTIKFFSGFYNSDIIFASPLGLMRTITTGGGKKENKGHDADFLSSIEVVIMDHANALEMQNWQHVDYVFSQLNLLPKESHGADFARARSWYLDGKAKYLRQTILFSDYLTPSISALASAHLHNVAGRIKYTPTYTGAMLNLSPSIPLTLTQSFLRFDSVSPHADSDARFKFFTSTILPNLLRSSNKAINKGTLIFVPTYLDFVRLRNHFSTAQETTSLAFGTISEYSPKGDVARARSHFLNGRHSIMLYSERAHHYFRYKIKGIRRIIFYGVPENSIFWTEMIDSLGMNAQMDPEWAQAQRGKQGKGLVRAIFSKWDVMKLERIVGTERVGRLVSEREGDVFEFV